MDILQMYVFKRYITILFGSILFFIFLFVVVRYSESIDVLLRISDSTSVEEYINFFVYDMPFSVLYLFPMSSLFALVFVLGKFNEHNELYIFYFTGKSIWFFLYPIIFFLTTICLLLVFFNETVIYIPHQKFVALNAKFRQRERKVSTNRENLVQFGKNNKLYVIDYFDISNKSMNGAKIFFNEGKKKFTTIIRSEKVTHKDGTFWSIKSPFYYEFDDKKLKYSRREDETKDLGDYPFYFDEVFYPEDMSIQQVNAEAKKAEIIGGDMAGLWTEFYLKIATPFAALVTFFLAIPLSIFTKKSVVIRSFIYSVLLAFIYMVILNIGISFGKNGLLPPVIGAWLGNIIFTILAIVGYRKLRK